MRWIVIIAIAFGLYKGGAWLLDHPGQVMVDWLGFEITLHMAAIAAILLVFTLAVGYLSVLLWKLVTWPARRRSRNVRTR